MLTAYIKVYLYIGYNKYKPMRKFRRAMHNEKIIKNLYPSNTIEKWCNLIRLILCWWLFCSKQETYPCKCLRVYPSKTETNMLFLSWKASSPLYLSIVPYFSYLLIIPSRIKWIVNRDLPGQLLRSIPSLTFNRLCSKSSK